MSSPPHSNQPLEHEKNQESDVVHPQIPVNPETLSNNQPDPETRPLENPEYPEEEEDEEEDPKDVQGKELEIPEENAVISSGMPQPLSACHVSSLDVTPPVSSPKPNPNFWRGANKRNKGKGKFNAQKQQMFEKKLQSLMENLNTIPFMPHKILDFSKHEELLRKLGLWDFVHIDFDRNLRKDLIAQLVASYQSRCSWVNGYRIGVNRAELARAIKIPTKKDKGNVGGVQMDIDFEPLSDNSIGFMVEFLSDWVLLHEDMWMMPNEVINCIKLIKDGHPENVDWAGLIWFMVEKELIQGENLQNCYYASHLQHLMKEQKAFLREEADGKLVEMDEGVKEVEENVNDTVKCQEDERNGEIEGPSVELTLGQDEGEKRDEIKDEEIMNFENCKEESEEEGVSEQEQWLMNGNNDMEDHYMQRCNSQKKNELELGDTLTGKVEEQEEELEFEEDDEEAGDKFNVFPNDDLVGEGLTGNFLQAMETNQIAFGAQGQEIDMQNMDPGPSFLNKSGKRAIEHENVMFNNSLNDSNKRLRINVSSNQNPVNFGTCMENVQQMVERARILYVDKEQALEDSNLNQQILLNELQKRDNVIELLNKSRIEEMQKKDNEIYRYERELYLMGNVLEGYRKAVKETQKAFDEYREKVQLPEEPAYRDVGGGLMLSTGEIERIKKKQEEEFQMNCLIVEQRMKDAEQDFVGQFDAFLEKINMMDKRLTGLDADAIKIIGLFAKRKVLKTDEKALEVAEAMDNEEKVPEVAEAVDNEEKVPEVVDAVDNEEKVPEVALETFA